MTSGNKDEKVDDNSVFIKYLLQKLNTNREEFLSASQLFNEVKPNIISNSGRIPQMGDLNKTGDEGGDFIFIRRKY